MNLADRIIEILEDYGGLPLTVNDIAEESEKCRETVRALLSRLIERGVVASWPDPENPQRFLYARRGLE